MDHLPSTTRAAVCPEHGDYESRLVLGRLWSQCPTCSEESVAREQECRRRLAEERRERERDQRLAHAGIPARFVGRTIETFKADTPAQLHAASVARDFVENFAENLRSGRGLIFSGLPGTGKSHLAGAIVQALVDEHRVRYMTCMDLIREVRATWRRDSERDEASVLRALGHLSLLVIDEIGVQYGTDGEQTITFDVLDRRYRDAMPTILLTNQDKEGLKTFIGERAFDRLTETCRWVPFDWESYRQQARRDATPIQRLSTPTDPDSLMAGVV